MAGQQRKGHTACPAAMCQTFLKDLHHYHWAMFMIVISKRQSFDAAFNKLLHDIALSLCKLYWVWEVGGRRGGRGEILAFVMV